ncbi:hypothetical protein L9F63_023627, partial [Diploptera punctata]
KCVLFRNIASVHISINCDDYGTYLNALAGANFLTIYLKINRYFIKLQEIDANFSCSMCIVLYLIPSISVTIVVLALTINTMVTCSTLYESQPKHTLSDLMLRKTRNHDNTATATFTTTMLKTYLG